MVTQGAKRGGIKTSKTVFGIIEAIQSRERATLSEVAADVGIANSTAHEHLTTLLDLEYLIIRNRKYELGLKFLEHGMRAKEAREVSMAAKPILERLAEETGEVAWLFLEEHGWAVYIDRATGKHAIITDGKIGRRRHLHCIAGGKAILAEMTDERVQKIIDRHGLPLQTRNTIVDVDELFDELETIRERGYAFNKDEAIGGLRAVGTGIKIDEDTICSVVVAGPSQRMRGDRFSSEIPEAILGAANALQLKLAYP